MKRTLILIVSLFVAMILTACGNTSTNVETDEVESQEGEIKNVKKENKDADESVEHIHSQEELEEIVGYSVIGEDDELVSVAFEDNEIKVVIDMQDSFEERIMASTRYSQLSDELLKYEDWETLTVEFVDIGTISMNRSEKESNEYGDYFPKDKIDEILNVEY